MHVVLAASVLLDAGAAQAAPNLPEIRLSRANQVPACVTPERLMTFLKRRNGNLSPRFRDIAFHYQRHGQAWGVRWDYAFFQMAIETNFLTYRQPNGRMGDVDPRQNNFAGIGTTGGGVPGDSFPDVSTGVLGQIQHLVVYSGEMIAKPVAPRTQLKQEFILAKSRELNRPVRFSDLARRWAADPKYASSIEWVAENYRSEYCRGRQQAPPPARQEREILPWQQPVKAPPGRAEAPPKKVIATADASASVHTIWRRDGEKATPVHGPDGRAVASNTTVAAVDVASGPADGPPVKLATSADEAPGFALFSPPVGLASAQPSRIETAAPAAIPMAAPSEPVATAQRRTAIDPGAAKEAPDAPVAVAGASVGGFLIGGPSKSDFQPPSGLGMKLGRCVVEAARYGGETTLLIKSPEGPDVHYIALSVLDGFEDSMTKSFLATRAEGGEVIGSFPSRDGALAKARGLCPQ